MKTTLLLLALCIPVLAQDAPTIQQCRADFAMWQVKSTNFDSLSTADMMHRGEVMSLCGMTGKTQRAANMTTLDEAIEIGQWIGLESSYELRIMTRMLNYIKRHGQLEQFWKEDAAGLR
jgi:hypothetical protein